jgi:putative transposase
MSSLVRFVVGISHANLDGSLTLTALPRALKGHAPELHHSDQSVRYANDSDVGLLRFVGCQISMATGGEPTENGDAERLVRTIKEEHMALTEYEGYTDAYQQLSRFLDDMYQHKRIYAALGYVTPIEFERQWHKEQEESAASAKPRP